MDKESRGRQLGPRSRLRLWKQWRLKESLDKAAPFLNHWLHNRLPLLPPVSPFYHSLKRENFLVFRVAYQLLSAIGPSARTNTYSPDIAWHLSCFPS